MFKILLNTVPRFNSSVWTNKLRASCHDARSKNMEQKQKKK